ncbi:MAG: hypothetical protein FJX62_15390, partial [Alphaproteobacteria bacterium]|nr:hypothetical protein [Alphaproteobacteria bacterium]
MPNDIFWGPTAEPALIVKPSEGIKMKDWIKVLRAADAAARWHVHQRRKGAGQEPYINHLLEVAMLVAEACDGGD